MAETTVVRCIRCGEDVALLDENGRCEQCLIDAMQKVCGPLTRLEELVKDWLDDGLTPSQLQEALEMCLLDTEGPLTGTPLTRESVGTCERGMWHGPPSLFDDKDASRLSPISYWRHMERLSLEVVASRLGVAVSELALWEHGALPPREHAWALSDMFGVSLDFLLGVSKDPLECARCGAEASGNLARFEQGWDVAGGTELVCPNCLMPGDLDW
jgi:DNA-directed RNA polymerase subunit RPC12/RpoP